MQSAEPRTYFLPGTTDDPGRRIDRGLRTIRIRADSPWIHAGAATSARAPMSAGPSAGERSDSEPVEVTGIRWRELGDPMVAQRQRQPSINDLAPSGRETSAALRSTRVQLDEYQFTYDDLAIPAVSQERTGRLVLRAVGVLGIHEQAP